MRSRRPAEILGYEMDDKDPALIRGVKVATAFLQRPYRLTGRGSLEFVCPFCGKTHSHGAGGLNFGDGDGHRVPHCDLRGRASTVKDAQSTTLPLSPYWEFILEEVEDFSRAGEFPRRLHRLLTSRKSSARSAK